MGGINSSYSDAMMTPPPIPPPRGLNRALPHLSSPPQNGRRKISSVAAITGSLLNFVNCRHYPIFFVIRWIESL